MKKYIFNIKQIGLLLVLLQALVLQTTKAQTEEDYKLLKKANKAYTEGKFQDATEMYEKLVKSGLSAAELYYNLGNSYYRLKDYKSAILYYEKAKLLKPDDENIAINLEYCNSFIQDKIETVPKFFMVTWVESFTSMFSEKSWSVISIATFMLLLLAIVFFLFTKRLFLRKLSTYISLVAIVISLLSFFSASKQSRKITRHNTAIVFSPAVTVKSAPGNETGTDLFVIHEGLKVSIIGESQGWKEIKLSDGQVGWLPSESIVEI